MKNPKEIILNAIQALPENAGFEDVIEKLYLMSKIEKGISQADQEQTFSHEDAQQKFSKWLK